jgi:hypothetical protein
VYQTIIEADGGDDRVKARSWLINLPEVSITLWDQLCAIFIGNF